MQFCNPATVVPASALRRWGARAIFNPGQIRMIDVLHDRQSYEADDANFKDELAPERIAFHLWLEQRALPELQRLIKAKGTDRRDDDSFTIDEFRYVLEARVTGGYVYITAYQHKVEKIGKGTGPLAHCDIYARGFDRGNSLGDVLWSGDEDRPLPYVGDDLSVSRLEGKITGKVIGFSVLDGYIHAVLKPTKAPAAWYAERYKRAKQEIEQKAIRDTNALLSKPMPSVAGPKIKRMLEAAGLRTKAEGVKTMRERATLLVAGVDLPKPVEV